MESASPLKAWTDFYVIVGSSAAALTGLMFVAITLVASLRARTSRREGIAAYSTPTVVFFCAALLIAAAATAPWPRLACVSGLLAIAALIGLAYSIRITTRASALDDYEPDLEDRISYMILPVVAYCAMLAAALALSFQPTTALFGLAGTSLLLIFLGIHNAWDVVTYVGVQRLRAEHAEESEVTTAHPPHPRRRNRR